MFGKTLLSFREKTACPEEAISLVDLEGVGLPPADPKAVMKQIAMERRALQNRP